MNRHVVPSVISALVLCAITRAVDDEVVVKRRPEITPAQREAESIREFSEFYRRKLLNIGKSDDGASHLKALQKLARNVQRDTPEVMAAKEVANAEANYKSIKLSKEESEIVRLPFKNRKAAHGKVNETAYSAGGYGVCEVGPIRIVSKEWKIHGVGSATGIACGTYVPEPQHGSHGGVSETQTEYVASFSEGEETTLLINNTVATISRDIMRLAGKYFALRGKRAVVFLYDAATIDKIVVLHD
jgi:hypothetical protein